MSAPTYRRECQPRAPYSYEYPHDQCHVRDMARGFSTRGGSVPVCPWGSNMNCQHMAPCAVLGWIFGRMYARWCTRQMVSDAAKLFDSRVAVA